MFRSLLSAALSVLSVFPALAGGNDALARVHALIPAPKSIQVRDSLSCARLSDVYASIDTALDVAAEGYKLRIDGGSAVITAKDSVGLIWAQATLRQLCCPDSIVADVTVTDWPAFPIRGFMYDTGRNFRSIDALERDIRLFSDYKVNVFHWHLTDYPAWRIECKAYPQLNDSAFRRQGRDVDSTYTYDQIRHIIAYARERGITVIPEIDMPGHSTYFDSTFGFPMASPEGMNVLDTLLREFLAEIGPECPYIHIGSDEVRIDNAGEFMTFCEGVVRKSGRTPVSWNPGLPVSPFTVRQIWSGNIGRDIESSGTYDGPYIDSYQGYLNLGHPVANTAKYFLHRHCGRAEADSLALGGILCLWNDVRVADKSRLLPHNGMPNGLLAFAESIWCGGERQSLDNENLFPVSGAKASDDLLDFERRLAYHRDSLLRDYDMRWVANAAQPWSVTIGSAPDSVARIQAYGGVIDLKALCADTGIAPQPAMVAWAETEIYVPADTVIAAWVGFEAPARSDRISDGIGSQGCWEAGGRLYVGDREIFPPHPWNEPGAHRYHEHTWHKPVPEETPYTDEQLPWMRTPARVPLKAGWNIIKLYCPRVFDNPYWFATFIPLTVDPVTGRVREATGIRYRLPSQRAESQRRTGSS